MADSNIELFKQAISGIHKKLDKEKFDNSINVKPAKVIGVDEETYRVFVYFLDDVNQREYTFYNKSGEILSEGDNVKIYYTTNPAKGWIGARCGEPSVKEIEQVIPYVSKHIYNTVDSELAETPAGVFDIDFTVIGNNSDCYLNANQIINTSSAGTVLYNYFIDKIQSDFHLRQVLSLGNNVVTHIIPMELLEGNHNVAISMVSADAKGTTVAGEVQGVISGQIADISFETPTVYSCIFKIEVESGVEVDIPYFGADGVIYWGDGTSDIYTSAVSKHTYSESGNYKITIDASLSSLTTSLLNYSSRNLLKEVVLSDNITVLDQAMFRGCTNLTSVKLNNNLSVIGAGVFDSTGLTGNIIIPSSVTRLGEINTLCYGTFADSNITSLRIDKHNQPLTFGFKICSGCKQLTNAYLDFVGNVDYLSFYNCTSLSNLTLGRGIQYIGESAFGGCKALTDVEIPDTVTEIGYSGFGYCSALRNVTIPKSVKSIGKTAFYGTSLKEVKIAKDCSYVTSGVNYENSFPLDCIVSFYD